MIARQKEFYRDRSSMGWNLAFPFFVVLGFAFAFSNGDQKLYKVGLMGDFKSERVKEIPFLKTQYVEFVKTEKGEKYYEDNDSGRTTWTARDSSGLALKVPRKGSNDPM
mgnify:CR=1 FL=1